jgi:hypothetical protein
MEVGIPMSLQSPSMGELVFNDFSGTAATIGGAQAFPLGLGAGCGYLIQRVQGFDGAPIRNPVDNRPHKSGGIVHTFRRAAKVWTVEGIICVPDNVSGPIERATRTVLEDALRGYSDSVMAVTARFFFQPSGQVTRFQECRLYEPIDIGYDVISGPKNFSMTLVAADSRAYNYTQDLTVVLDGVPIAVPNEGNTESWPVIEVSGPSSGFTLANAGGFTIDWTGSLGAGHHIEVDMFRETMYNDGSGANRLGGLNLSNSDFWSIPPGGTTVSLDGAPDAQILSNSAWV